MSDTAICLLAGLLETGTTHEASSTSDGAHSCHVDALLGSCLASSATIRWYSYADMQVQVTRSPWFTS